jgi:hypothetical protein
VLSENNITLEKAEKKKYDNIVTPTKKYLLYNNNSSELCNFTS